MVQSGAIPEQRKPDAGWRYHNADGSDAGAVYRWDLSDGRKEIRQVSCVGGGWITSAMKEPRPLFNLPSIIASDEVWIVEGEKSCDAAVLLGLTATCSAGGSNAAEKSDWRPLDGKTVCILPDSDEAGKKYATEVASLIGKQCPNGQYQSDLKAYKGEYKTWERTGEGEERRRIWSGMYGQRKQAFSSERAKFDPESSGRDFVIT